VGDALSEGDAGAVKDYPCAPMSLRRLHWLFWIACSGVVGGAATLILSDILQRPVLSWVGLGLAVAGGIAGMVGGAFVMAMTLNGDDHDAG
jgi:hypothetical protein